MRTSDDIKQDIKELRSFTNPVGGHGIEIQIDTNDGYDGSHYPKYRSLPYDLHQECLSAIYAVIRKRINALNDELADALEAETLAMQDEINKLRNR